MKTVDEVRSLSIRHLEEKGVPSPRKEAEELIADALGTTRMQLFLQFERPLNEEELKRCRDSLQRRSQREPLQYIHGTVSFYETILTVTPAVLIPRPETEILVDRIVQTLRDVPLEEKTLLDLCTGSGCIAIALKKALPNLRVIASDLSEEALAVAQKNGISNEVDVEWVHSDLFEKIPLGSIDYLVSNPPYVSEDEFFLLEPEVKQHEPRLALVSGPSGLEIFDQIAVKMQPILKQEGTAWFEMGAGQGEALISCFRKAGWEKIQVDQDWSEKDRFIEVRRA